MNKKRTIALIIISVLLVISMFISVSYGYYVINTNKTVEMNATTSTPSCIGLHITSNNTFTLEKDYAVPITEDQFLNSNTTTQEKFKYSFTINNDCDTQKSLKIGVVTADNTGNLASKLKYILVESNIGLTKENIKSLSSTSSTLSDDMQEYLKNIHTINSNTVYNVGNVEIANKASKTYDLYMWLDSTADSDTMEKEFKYTVVLYN